MDPSLCAELAKFAETLADAARKEILPYWRKPIPVESKMEADRPVAESPVTIADRKAEEAMRKLIEVQYPTHGIRGEEFGDLRPEAKFCWVLDPIDGTKSFITGKPLFGTLIGLCYEGRPVIGVIDQCVLNERWVGIVDQGTTLNGKPVKASGVTQLSDAMLYATTPLMFKPGFETERFNSIRDAVKRPLFGADCYAYALVASGFGADLVVEADLGIYDYTALVPVLKGAGGVMTDWNGNELTIQQQGDCQFGRVVAAANAALHAAAISKLSNSNGSACRSVLKKHLQNLAPYLPPLDGRDNQKHLLLDFNERTLPVPPHVIDALKSHLDTKGLHSYPAYGDLNVKIAEYAGVRPEECMFTNGSDQGIDLIVRACCPEGSEAIIPSPTFAMYDQAALTEGLVIKAPHFTFEKGFPTEEVLASIGPNTTLIVFSNPNNPTGTHIPREDMIKIIEKAPHSAILVDECYFEFMDPDSSMKGEIARFPNLFVTRTFSKTWGIPALRIGYLLSCEANIRALCSVRGPYDINHLAGVALQAAFANRQYVFDYVDEVNKKTKPKIEDFLRSRGIDFWPTASNYIFCYFKQAAAIEGKLRAKNILVRPKKDAAGVVGLRMSFGTLAQTDRLIAALEEILDDIGEHPAKKPKL